MKNKFILALFISFQVIIVLSISSCKKDTIITSPDALISFSEDTLHFDTVFVTQGSTIQFMKIFNLNDEKIRISKIELAGGAASFFKLNVDGISNTVFKDIEVEANDSLYLFAQVNINPNAANLPFIVKDSVKFEFNGNTKWLQLDAYGKNANFMRGRVIAVNETFKNNLPIVILDSLVVAPNTKLSINPGTQIYVHANAPIIINGSLSAIGDTGKSRIVFQGIRIDEPYRDFPGSWPGIYFSASSTNNLLQQCVIKNAYRGITALGNIANKIVLQECVFDNIYDIALFGVQSNIKATNCLISNVGYGLYTLAGGNYDFNYCTFASISNSYLAHKNPLINLSNTTENNTTTGALNASFKNSIIYGDGGFVDDEIVTTKILTGTGFTASFSNVLYKQKNANSNFTITNSILNQLPNFDSINTSKRYFDFRLKQNSPCVDASDNLNNVSNDLNKMPRNIGGKNDIGCYERQ